MIVIRLWHVMIMLNEESEWVLQVVRCIYLPFLLIKFDNCDFEAEEIVNGSLK